MKTVQDVINEMQELANKHGNDTTVIVYNNDEGKEVEDFDIEYSDDDEDAEPVVLISI